MYKFRKGKAVNLFFIALVVVVFGFIGLRVAKAQVVDPNAPNDAPPREKIVGCLVSSDNPGEFTGWGSLNIKSNVAGNGYSLLVKTTTSTDFLQKICTLEDYNKLFASYCKANNGPASFSVLYAKDEDISSPSGAKLGDFIGGDANAVGLNSMGCNRLSSVGNFSPIDGGICLLTDYNSRLPLNNLNLSGESVVSGNIGYIFIPGANSAEKLKTVCDKKVYSKLLNSYCKAGRGPVHFEAALLDSYGGLISYVSTQPSLNQADTDCPKDNAPVEDLNLKAGLCVLTASDNPETGTKATTFFGSLIPSYFKSQFGLGYAYVLKNNITTLNQLKTACTQDDYNKIFDTY
jgi:hypothetical protein